MRRRDLRGIAKLTMAGAMATCAAAAGHSAQASGFALREGSTDWMANAFAGDTAKAYDASTVWANPAGMVRLNQNEIDASINGIFPTINFSGANFVGRTATTSGTTGGNLIQSAATGGSYAVWSVTPDFKIGFGADSPFGQRVTNPGNFVGRYQSLVSSITDIGFTVSAAYKINEQFSIGGGPVIDYFKSRLTQAINIGPASALTGDPVADLHGDDVSAGFNIGLLWQPTPDVRFGVDYRSRIAHSITGTQSIFVPPILSVASPITAAQLAFLNTSARTKITLPDSATVGAYWQVTPQLALLADASWTDWSLLQSLNVTPVKPGVPGSTIIENWRDTYSVSVGANYRVIPQLMLQTGIGFDQTPVKDSFRTSRIPDTNRYLVSVGAQYDILPSLTLQAAYSHVFFDSGRVSTQASATSGLLVGKYTNAADTASLGVKYRF